MSYPASWQGSSADTATGSSAHATLTYAAIPLTAHVLAGVAWSYSNTPTSGRLTISDDTTVIFDMDITSGGPGFIPFTPAKEGSINKPLVIKLFNGGVVGKVNSCGKWTIRRQ
jgi:hypothetical protein